MPVGEYISDFCPSGICVPLMASLTPTGSEARQPVTFRARYRVRRGWRGRLPTRFLLRERTGRKEKKRDGDRKKEKRTEKEKRTLFGRSVGWIHLRERGRAGPRMPVGRPAGPGRFNMSARSIDAIDRPTESPYFRRTSSPTRAPIVLGYRSPLRSAGLVRSRLPPSITVHRSCTCRSRPPFLSFSFSLFHSSLRFARADSIFAAGLRRKFH